MTPKEAAQCVDVTTCVNLLHVFSLTWNMQQGGHRALKSCSGSE